jgi:hypothetical protein
MTLRPIASAAAAAEEAGPIAVLLADHEPAGPAGPDQPVRPCLAEAELRARKVLGWPNICKLAHVFMWLNTAIKG